MLNRKEAAKFFCGFESFHVLLNAYMLLSGTTLTVVGITMTSKLLIVFGVMHAVVAVVLGVYAWKQPEPTLREATA